MKTSALCEDLASQITDLITAGRIAPGDHLSAQNLADQFGVSRSPVREALQMLEKHGTVEKKRNRGYFALKPPPARDGELVAEMQGSTNGVNSYQRVADAWLNDEVSADVTEMQLREQFELTKAQLNDVLVRAVREGWAERKQGYGWRFLPVAKTTESFEQIYRFRMLVEPAALLEPSFSIDVGILEELKNEQEHILSSDIGKLPAEFLLNSGTRFHEEIIKFSGNPFFHISLVRVNRMRRLLEYRARINRERFVVQCQQHLELIQLLKSGEIAEASYFMRRHLSGALTAKSPVAWPDNT